MDHDTSFRSSSHRSSFGNTSFPLIVSSSSLLPASSLTKCGINDSKRLFLALRGLGRWSSINQYSLVLFTENLNNMLAQKWAPVAFLVPNALVLVGGTVQSFAWTPILFKRYWICFLMVRIMLMAGVHMLFDYFRKETQVIEE